MGLLDLLLFRKPAPRTPVTPTATSDQAEETSAVSHLSGSLLVSLSAEPQVAAAVIEPGAVNSQQAKEEDVPAGAHHVTPKPAVIVASALPAAYPAEIAAAASSAAASAAPMLVDQSDAASSSSSVSINHLSSALLRRAGLEALVGSQLGAFCNLDNLTGVPCHIPCGTPLFHIANKLSASHLLASFHCTAPSCPDPTNPQLRPLDQPLARLLASVCRSCPNLGCRSNKVPCTEFARHASACEWQTQTCSLCALRWEPARGQHQVPCDGCKTQVASCVLHAHQRDCSHHIKLEGLRERDRLQAQIEVNRLVEEQRMAAMQQALEQKDRKAEMVYEHMLRGLGSQSRFAALMPGSDDAAPAAPAAHSSSSFAGGSHHAYRMSRTTASKRHSESLSPERERVKKAPKSATAGATAGAAAAAAAASPSLSNDPSLVMLSRFAGDEQYVPVSALRVEVERVVKYRRDGHSHWMASVRVLANSAGLNVSGRYLTTSSDKVDSLVRRKARALPSVTVTSYSKELFVASDQHKSDMKVGGPGGVRRKYVLFPLADDDTKPLSSSGGDRASISWTEVQRLAEAADDSCSATAASASAAAAVGGASSVILLNDSDGDDDEDVFHVDAGNFDMSS